MNILITAGPTWSPIDKVRVITNIFGGALGYEIAKVASDQGHNVTFLLGPSRVCQHKLDKLNVKIVRFHFYKELLNLFRATLKQNKYHVVIHAAAVSDYVISKENQGKIKSGKRRLVLVLKPTMKIVNLVKKLQPDVYLVKFKLEVNNTKKELIRIANKSMKESCADMIVANDFRTVTHKHEAIIITSDKKIRAIIGKEKIAKMILSLLSTYHK